MKSAQFLNGEKIAASEYDVRVHGKDVFCKCGARVICVTPNNDEREPFFKTTGKGDSQHKNGCGEIRNLHINYIEQAIRYVDTVKPVPEDELVVISFELGRKKSLSGSKSSIENESTRHCKPNYINKPSHIENKSHQSIKTLKKIATLIKKNEPEQLYKIAFKMHGKLLSFFDLVVDQNIAYEKARISSECNQEYIVYGKVQSIVKKDKVMFINFDEQEGARSFALVVFANKFEQFSFVDKLEGRFVLAFGNITPKKGYDGTQMILNDHKHLFELPE